MHQTQYWHCVEEGEKSSLTIFVSDCRIILRFLLSTIFLLHHYANQEWSRNISIVSIMLKFIRKHYDHCLSENAKVYPKAL